MSINKDDILALGKKKKKNIYAEEEAKTAPVKKKSGSAGRKPKEDKVKARPVGFNDAEYEPIARIAKELGVKEREFMKLAINMVLKDLKAINNNESFTVKAIRAEIERLNKG